MKKKTFEQFRIDRYGNKIKIIADPGFCEQSEWGNPRGYKNYNWWVSLMNYLRKRGFQVSQNQYMSKHYEAIATRHRIGVKKDVICLLENSSTCINLDFGNVKNLWKDHVTDFWDNPTDFRYTKLTYLENLAVESEILKLVSHLKSLNIKGSGIDRKKRLPNQESIIQKLQENKHIHGDIQSLEQLCTVVNEKIESDPYFGKYNAKDQNNKTILCGELKHFYDYRRRLRCGIAYHNINNMWWVISGGDMFNKACFDLFDYDPELPKKEPIRRGQYENLITKFLNEKNYLKCHILEQRKKVLFPESVNEKQIA